MNSVPTKRPRLHLDFLDGIRGVAALYVVLHHAGMVSLQTMAKAYSNATPPVLLTLLNAVHFALFNHGHYAVVVFIVLSGFCLMLPIARAGNAAPFDFFRFFQRRARRILPPYYAAVAISLCVCALPGLNVITGFGNDVQLPAFTPQAIGTHLLLIHNLFPAYAAKINAPLWSVALEWQIYFVFALILIPVWKRVGVGLATVLALILGILPNILIPPTSPIQWGTSWLLAAFGFGMGAAVLCFGQEAKLIRWRTATPHAPFLIGAGVLGGMIAVVLLLQRKRFEQSPLLCALQFNVNRLDWAFDLVVALWTVLLIVGCVRWRETRPRSRPIALRIFEARPAVVLGTFSYSLYLLHGPLLVLGDLFVRRATASGAVALLLFWGVAVPRRDRRAVPAVLAGGTSLPERSAFAARNRRAFQRKMKIRREIAAPPRPRASTGQPRFAADGHDAGRLRGPLPSPVYGLGTGSGTGHRGQTGTFP